MYRTRGSHIVLLTPHSISPDGFLFACFLFFFTVVLLEYTPRIVPGI